MTQVLICDDHELVRAAIARALQAAGAVERIEQCASGRELLTRLESGPPPPLLLLDLNTDRGGAAAGLALLERIGNNHPECRPIVLSMYGEPDIVDRAMRAGARGYVAKGSSMSVLIDALVAVRRGGRYVDPSLVEGLLMQREQTAAAWDAALSPREREVMTRLCAGQRLAGIASDMGVSIKTVSTHKMRLMDKLHVDNNADLIKLGLEHGLR